jgi:hypothetical protein
MDAGHIKARGRLENAAAIIMVEVEIKFDTLFPVHGEFGKDTTETHTIRYGGGEFYSAASCTDAPG